VIPPRSSLDDEDTRLVTSRRAHAASVDHLDAVVAIAADICAMIASPSAVSSAVHPAPGHDVRDDDLDEWNYRAAMASLTGVVQRSLRDFLAAADSR
jgi:hypothetical protein